MSVHRHPQSILEVRRILKLHIVELRTFPYGGGVEYANSPDGSSESPLPPSIATFPSIDSPR
jgi:hypothetical protein